MAVGNWYGLHTVLFASAGRGQLTSADRGLKGPQRQLVVAWVGVSGISAARLP